MVINWEYVLKKYYSCLTIMIG